MDLNKSLEVKTKSVNHIKNLIAIACIDGDFSPNERSLIYKIGKKSGLTDFEVNQFMTKPIEADLLIPKTTDERITHFHNYLELIISDGKVVEEELEFCNVVANVLGFAEEEVINVLKEKYNFEL